MSTRIRICRVRARISPICRALVVALPLLTAACSSSSGGDDDPDPINVSGIWDLRSEVIAADGVCSDELGSVDSFRVQVTQVGSNVTVVRTESPEFTLNGTIVGNKINVSGTYSEDGGMTSIVSTNYVVEGDELSGESSWTWSDGVESCPGPNSSRVSGSRVSTSAPPAESPRAKVVFQHPDDESDPVLVTARGAGHPWSPLGRIEPGDELAVTMAEGLWDFRLAQLRDGRLTSRPLLFEGFPVLGGGATIRIVYVEVSRQKSVRQLPR